MIGVSSEMSIKDISFEVSVEDSLKNLKPHPKFNTCSFENYYPDQKYKSQAEVKELLFNKINKLNSKKNSLFIKKRSFFDFFSKSSSNNRHQNIKNVYLDGGYGVGKTHLLAACYNIAECKKAFMSFSEMCYYINYLGINESIKIFSKYDLLLIDEFEIDDPATVRMMAKFFEEINKNTLIITTSNTLPSDLGKDRFQADEFKREMGVIANTFKVVKIDGEDYRRKKKEIVKNIENGSFEIAYGEYECTGSRKKCLVNFEELMNQLEQIHPFRFYLIPEHIEALFIRDFKPFPMLNTALRFTYLVDMCYYYNTKLFIKSVYKLDDIFSREMIESCFEKKLKRCLSRLGEISTFYER